MNKKKLWSEKINENKTKASKTHCFSANIFILIHISFMNYIHQSWNSENLEKSKYITDSISEQ